MRLLKTTTTGRAFIIALALAATILTTDACAANSGTPTAHKPGQVFRDCPDCPELVVVPSGIFIMGLKATSKKCKPAHRVNISKPFAMGRFEVKFSEWQACHDAGACNTKPNDHRWGKKDRPVINVTYHDAKRYLTWISKRKPGIATDCRPKQSGNMPTARAPSPFGGGETKSARTTPTVRNAKARGAMAERKFIARPRSDRSRPIPLACTTPPPMFLNGSMIAGTNPTKTRPKTARPGPRAIAVAGSSGVVRSIIIQRLPGRPTGPKTHPT